MIDIKVNEQSLQIERGISLFNLKRLIKPEADVVVLNGYPVSDDGVLSQGDTIVFIKRGEVPPPEELEGLMMARHTPGVHAVLRTASVGIAGLGGLGSSVAVALARTGVGRMVLADYDVVEPSNLNRQQYFIDQIGMLKAEALTETLKRINPSIDYETHALKLTPETVKHVFRGVNVIVEAFDKAEEKAMLAETVLASMNGIRLVCGSGMAGYESANLVVTRHVGGALICCGDGKSPACPGQGLMAPRVGVVAHHQANAVLRILLGLDSCG